MRSNVDTALKVDRAFREWWTLNILNAPDPELIISETVGNYQGSIYRTHTGDFYAQVEDPSSVQTQFGATATAALAEMHWALEFGGSVLEDPRAALEVVKVLQLKAP